MVRREGRGSQLWDRRDVAGDAGVAAETARMTLVVREFSWAGRRGGGCSNRQYSQAAWGACDKVTRVARMAARCAGERRSD